MTTRCPTCDLEIVQHGLDCECHDEDTDVYCVRHEDRCTNPPIDWRTRALKAEGEVERMRPIVEAAEEWKSHLGLADVRESEVDLDLWIVLDTDATKESKL